MPLDLTFAVGPYDRIQPLLDGRVQLEGTRLNILSMQPEECFWRMMQHEEFDISEMSLSSYTIAVSRGDRRFVGIPAFVSRSFRHSSIYVRDDDSVREPADLAGRRIGVPEYQMTASVWTRGLLTHDAGVDLRDVTWRTGGLEQPGREERQALVTPDWLSIEPIPSDTTLNAALLAGEIDAIMAPRVPSIFRRPDGGGIRRLFPDYREREKEYFARTGIFPLMHMVVVRREIFEQHPWIAASLLKALSQAKSVATEGLADLPALRYTMPFLLAALEEQQEVFGADPWPYGIEPNRVALETFRAYLVEQGLVAEAPTVEELFAPSTHKVSAI